ncbi:MAG: methionyl-tRNA formyltransferase [Gammaproteobacteria bacterium]
MRTFDLIFAGSSDFAAVSLTALLDAGHNIKAVLTQPDRPAGRRRKLTPTPVRELAMQRGLEVRMPSRLRDPDVATGLNALAADAMIVVDYGLLIPASILDLPRLGCINGHASLLPRWRGAAPIERAVLAGDEKTGITVMQMDRGLDTGDILLLRETPIEPEETAGQLRQRLASLCASALVEALALIGRGELAAKPQPETGSCYAEKLSAEDARLCWDQSALTLSRVVRAFNPRPGAWTWYRGQRIKILEATAISEPAGNNVPGLILGGGRTGMDVATGEGLLRVRSLQLPGGKAMNAAAFLNGHPAVGQVLGNTAADAHTDGDQTDE